MEDQKLEQRLQRIERRLQLLIVLSAIQAILLVVLVIWSLAINLMPSTLTLLILLIALGVAGYLFRHQIPRWLGNLSRMAFAQMLSTQEPDSFKDSGK